MKSIVFLLSAIAVFSGCGNTVADGGSTEGSTHNILPTNPYQMVTVTGVSVNLRQGPGTQYTIVGSVYAGDTLMVTGEAPDWYRVYFSEKSMFAWIYAGLTTSAELPR
jgi:uncharacterized protein YraI